MQKRHNPKKEKFVMLASSLLVLSALTLTGIYVKERSRIQNENSAELSREESVEENTEATENSAPVNVGTAVNPAVNEDALESEFGVYESRIQDKYVEAEEKNADDENTEDTDLEESVKSSSKSQALSFSKEEGLVWPIVGKVLIN